MKNPIIKTKKVHNFKDLTGQRFGRLLVVEHVGSEVVSKSGKIKLKSVFLVKCDCGNTKIMRGNGLNARTVKSCGCLGKEKTIEFNIKTKTKTSYSTFSAVWQSYKKGAKDRSLAFELSKEEFIALTAGNCDYCGIPPQQIRKSRTKGTNPSFVYNGIDRVNSDLGYHTANCVPCCKVCNNMKRDMTYDAFKEHIKKIHSHLRLAAS